MPDDRAALREIARVLKPSGRAVLLFPYDPKGPTREDPAMDTPAKRLAAFGHPYHYRIYGTDTAQRMAEAATPGAPAYVHRLEVQRDDVRERTGADEPREQQAGDVVVHQPGQDLPTGCGQQERQLVAQPLGIVAAQLRADAELGAGLQAQADEALEVVRSRWANGDTGTHESSLLAGDRLAGYGPPRPRGAPRPIMDHRPARPPAPCHPAG